MKPKNIYQGLALLVMALTTAACQNQLNDTAPQPQPGQKVNMTIRATQGTTPQTRTEYEDKQDEAGSIVVKWEGTVEEKINVFGYATNGRELTTPAELTSTPSTISEDGKSITFTGDVTAAENYVAIYPVNYKLEKGQLNFNFKGQKQDCATGKELAHLKNYDVMLGTPVEGDPNNYTFEHKAIMLRFDLNLPAGQKEEINKVTLTSNSTSGISTVLNGFLSENKLIFGGTETTKSISLDITNHAKGNQLKAYMMIPWIKADNVLTITVATNSGSTYEGILTTDSKKLIAGKCYILAPALALLPKINIPSAAEGQLTSVLENLDPASTQTELAVTGIVGDADITALANFLKEDKAKNITTLDLSGITNVIEVKGFEYCTKVTTVILPASATAIGANAFKGCTSMTEMFLHATIKKVGANAFDGCTALKALVFEGTLTASTTTEADKITLGTNILANCTHATLKILLPAITDPTKAATYKTALGKTTYYNFPGYSAALKEDKLVETNYTLLPGATSPSLPGGIEISGTEI